MTERHRIWIISGLYFEWVSEWPPCLGRIWTVFESWIWMSIRMESVSGAYLNYIWKLNLNEYQNGVRVWSVSKLYLKAVSEWVSGWNPCLERIWIVSECWIWMSIRMAPVSGAYLNCIRSWIWMSTIMASVSGAYLNCNWDLNKWQKDIDSGSYLDCILNEWQNDIRIWIVSGL